MPHRNRIDPFGAFHASPARGSRMGNRGILHDARGQIRPGHKHPHWVCCLTDFKDRRRPVLSPNAYTELFFLDEATALAAGHRPCGECQRARYLAFATALEAALGPRPTTEPRAKWIDGHLHPARIRRGRQVTHTARLSDLPQGAMIALGDGAALWWADRLWLWSFTGYTEAPAPPPTQVTVLTPAPTVAALRHGYTPQVALPEAGTGFRSAPAL